ncbi:hypothetical protein Scep_026137 [Stephania cephalantha]|uniref:Uncharacterized protein n=1 Tax=Stephania cephalantha TaxID=152367 RepID=A0AAP0EQ58_9MAGN
MTGRLEEAGHAVEARVLEIICHRGKGAKGRHDNLEFHPLHTALCGRLYLERSTSLKKGTEHEDEYMISEKEPLVNR